MPRIHDALQSRDYAIKASLGRSMIIARHHFVHPIFKYLVGNISIHAFEIIFKEFEQIKFLEICGCQMHPFIQLEDDDVVVEGQTSNTQLKKQSRSSKFSYVQKLKDIFSPSTTLLWEPTSHKNKAPSGPSTFYTNSLMSEIPNEFHPYVTNIEDVDGDGNCGFQAIVVSLGYSQDCGG
uniref:OTU domain-containing protein n=1 Tax=Lactuca sativa TaxID=4236 RepID=A0A9R1WHV0_LACSA|nr:hypothetical protein LSAT_V11C200083300 [Lactuca sativa]